MRRDDAGRHAGHAHSHAHDAAPPDTVRGRSLLWVLAGLVVLGTVVALVLLRPGAGDAVPDRVAQGERTAGTVRTVAPTPCSGDGASSLSAGLRCVAVTLELTDGPDRGREVREVSDRTALPALEPGRGVVLLRAGADVPFEERYQLVDVQRGRPLLLLTVLFAVAVVAVARLRGLLALVGLASSLLVLGGFVVPALLAGRPAVPTAVAGGTAVLVCALGLAHGLTLRSVTALLGTVAGLLVTLGLAAAFVELAALSGLSSEEASFVQAAFPDLDLRGLLLAGVVIGTLGVLDDVAVTQVSTVYELRRADPRQSRASLYAAAMRVGRDHIASTTNTLLLAYAGASLPVLVLFSSSDETLLGGITANVLAEEVVRTLAGSLGLISAVPLTTAIAAWSCPAPARDRLLEPLVVPDDPAG